MCKFRVWFYGESNQVYCTYVMADNYNQALEIAKQRDPRFHIVQEDPFPDYDEIVLC